MENSEFLRRAFSWHYSRKKVQSIPSIGQREFGIGSYGRKIGQRHISFPDEKALGDFLVKEAPLFISYSCAYYKKPSATPMDAKGFLGADLVYEFDADDFNQECLQEHDSWQCTRCPANGKGSVQNCPECGSAVKVEQWVCEKCLGKAKENVFLLLKILEEELGINEGISINFSGSKGYHLHVRSDFAKSLSARARIELVDYITGAQVNPESLGFYFEKGKFYSPKEKHALGWQKKILSRLRKIFSSDAEAISIATGVKLSTAKRILNESSTILNGISMGFLPGVVKNSEKFWNTAIASAISAESIPIDRQTSVDIRKIVRMPDTLHGSTGLNASIVPLDELKKFNPLADSIVFSEKMQKIRVGKTPKFFLNGNYFGPFSNEEVELPMYAAIFLIARGAAVVGV